MYIKYQFSILYASDLGNCCSFPSFIKSELTDELTTQTVLRQFLYFPDYTKIHHFSVDPTGATS